MHENQQVCINFVQAVKETFPELQKKVKVHLFLHLAQDMSDFGPTSAFSAERYGNIKVFVEYSMCNYNVLAGVKPITPLYGQETYLATDLPQVETLLKDLPSSSTFGLSALEGQ